MIITVRERFIEAPLDIPPAMDLSEVRITRTPGFREITQVAWLATDGWDYFLRYESDADEDAVLAVYGPGDPDGGGGLLAYLDVRTDLLRLLADGYAEPDGRVS